MTDNHDVKYIKGECTRSDDLPYEKWTLLPEVIRLKIINMIDIDLNTHLSEEKKEWYKFVRVQVPRSMLPLVMSSTQQRYKKPITRFNPKQLDKDRSEISIKLSELVACYVEDDKVAETEVTTESTNPVHETTDHIENEEEAIPISQTEAERNSYRRRSPKPEFSVTNEPMSVDLQEVRETEEELEPSERNNREKTRDAESLNRNLEDSLTTNADDNETCEEETTVIPLEEDENYHEYTSEITAQPVYEVSTTSEPAVPTKTAEETIPETLSIPEIPYELDCELEEESTYEVYKQTKRRTLKNRRDKDPNRTRANSPYKTKIVSKKSCNLLMA